MTENRIKFVVENDFEDAADGSLLQVQGGKVVADEIETVLPAPKWVTSDPAVALTESPGSLSVASFSGLSDKYSWLVRLEYVVNLIKTTGTGDAQLVTTATFVSAGTKFCREVTKVSPAEDFGGAGEALTRTYSASQIFSPDGPGNLTITVSLDHFGIDFEGPFTFAFIEKIKAIVQPVSLASI